MPRRLVHGTDRANTFSAARGVRVLTDSRTPLTPSAVAELALYVERMPMPSAMPSGVVSANTAAIERYVSLCVHKQRMSTGCDKGHSFSYIG